MQAKSLFSCGLEINDFLYVCERFLFISNRYVNATYLQIASLIRTVGIFWRGNFIEELYWEREEYRISSNRTSESCIYS